jgi:hypothetical protein
VTDLKVVEFPRPLPGSHQSVLKTLNDTMERAATGEVAGISIAWIDASGNGYTAWSKCDHRSSMVGAIAELLSEFTERTRS